MLRRSPSSGDYQAGAGAASNAAVVALQRRQRRRREDGDANGLRKSCSGRGRRGRDGARASSRLGRLSGEAVPCCNIERTEASVPQQLGTSGPSPALEKRHAFTYAEVVDMTNNFTQVIGRGGSGIVYYGCLKNGCEVAVKKLNKLFFHGDKQFAAEVKLLMTVHHRHLVSFIGYCTESDNMILICEYMSNGNLKELLSGKGDFSATSSMMSWRRRLQIAVNAASGLEYLHSGCRTTIIHRDVKTTNILLNEKLEAKLADFGLCRSESHDGNTHISTAVAGTPGYVDPEYFSTSMLTIKSDIYSFGVVLLEIISGRSAISTLSGHRVHIVDWAKCLLSEGNVSAMIDCRLEVHLNIYSLSKVVDLAILCTSEKGAMRPTMADVVQKLKEALEMETSSQETVTPEMTSSATDADLRLAISMYAWTNFYFNSLLIPGTLISITVKKKMMDTVLNFLLLLLLLSFSRPSFGRQGFISLDCGLPSNSSYRNEVGYTYTSDAAYIDSGVSKQVAPVYRSKVPAMYQRLRFFPEYERNCYAITPVTAGHRYLVRASFMYGDYDGSFRLPSFDLYLGPDFWYSLKFDNETHAVWTEIIGKASSSSMSVCLVRTSNGGTPFISGLELRPLDDDLYALANYSDALITYKRIDTGSSRQQRFKDDPYDRIWTPDYNAYGAPRNTTESITLTKNFMLPQAVAQTAVVSVRPIVISWAAAAPSDRFHFFIYFSEVQRFPVPQTRNITITMNGQVFIDPFDLNYLGVTTVYTTDPMSEGNYTFSIWVTRTSTLGPILNAFEIYKTYSASGYATYGPDADAITSIKAYYKVKRNWGGDPCLPKNIPWDGLGCNYDNVSTPRITSIDLSNSELTGNITDLFSELTALRTLNLSGNHLQGSIPDFFSTMMSLTALDLSNNEFTGTVPKALQERAKNGTLQLRVTNNHLSEISTNSSSANKMSNGMIRTVLVTCFILLID
ncbi:putative LRR receptor-like serine/threonine-protein kinase [Nymphaea thermarum]|nr:putative LRR receptor-like serine/threonine-protein kinase [Nymphaea thermarum]